MSPISRTSDQPILIIEDSPVDLAATKRAFLEAGVTHQLLHCEDGDEALDYFFRRGKYSAPGSAPIPSLVLLDLNLPGTDGREVLSQIKSDSQLRHIPVVALTTSDDERDVMHCYYAGANSYLQKPVDFDGFVDAIRRLVSYWFETVLLPNDAA